MKIFLAVTLICSCFFMLACENNINDVKALSNNAGGIDIGKNVAIYMSETGRMTAKMTAPIMKKYLVDSGQMVEFPNTINVDFFKDSAKVESKLSAKYARYIQDENKFFLKGDVVVYNIMGDTLWCKEMYWEQKTNKFHTDKEVVIKQHNPISKVYGLGFEANQDLTDITIFKPQANSFAIITDTSAFN